MCGHSVISIKTVLTRASKDAVLQFLPGGDPDSVTIELMVMCYVYMYVYVCMCIIVFCVHVHSIRFYVWSVVQWTDLIHTHTHTGATQCRCVHW